MKTVRGDFPPGRLYGWAGVASSVCLLFKFVWGHVGSEGCGVFMTGAGNSSALRSAAGDLGPAPTGPCYCL